MTTKGILAAAVGALAFSCAHQQQTKTDEAPPAPVAKAEPAAQPEKPSQQTEDLDAVVRATVIHFDFNQDTLTSDSQGQLQKLGDALRIRKDARVKIAGNCDERGTEEYNLALGQRRADVAKKYLVQLGVSARHIDTVSYGKEKPADPGHSEDAWAANRRDEFQPQQ